MNEFHSIAIERDTSLFLEEILRKLLEKTKILQIEEVDMLLLKGLEINATIAAALLPYDAILKTLAQRDSLIDKDSVHTRASQYDFGNLARYRVIAYLGAPPEVIDALAYSEGADIRTRKITLELLYSLKGIPLQQILDNTQNKDKENKP